MYNNNNIFLICEAKKEGISITLLIKQIVIVLFHIQITVHFSITEL
jgi:hypothetical protein